MQPLLQPGWLLPHPKSWTRHWMALSSFKLMGLEEMEHFPGGALGLESRSHCDLSVPLRQSRKALSVDINIEHCRGTDENQAPAVPGTGASKEALSFQCRVATELQRQPHDVSA